MSEDHGRSNVSQALTAFQGIADGDLAVAYLDPKRYVEHDPYVSGGVAGVRRYAEELASGDHRREVVRTLEDGAYVVIQSDGDVQGDGTFFDAFRFENSLIVEHWAFSAPAGPPNKSGHTQVDGPIEPQRDVDAENSKALVRRYYETVHLAGRHDQIRQFMSGDVQIRHEPGVADGVDEFERDLEVLTRDRTIDEIRLLLGQGDFVFLVAMGTHKDDPCAYVDLYRVEDDKLVEHWGFPEPVPPPDMRKNSNGIV